MKRRSFFRNLGIISAAAWLSPKVMVPESHIPSTADDSQVVDFPPLPFAYDALEPWIDARTMELHYDKHHRAYYNNYLAAVKGTHDENMTPEKLFPSISSKNDAIRNNAGGFYNHTFFWNNLAKNSGDPSAALKSDLEKTFGSLEKFQDAFNTAAKTRFGSGWAWLYVTPDRKLAVGSTPNQDNPLMDVAQIHGTPLLALDVWEHAYYLKYQNRRPEYIDAFWKVVNWNEVNRRYAKSAQSA